ncbi:GNAT family N-acetyltransferase [Kineothrix sp. MB12-C1]|uniref:GNAT family N-acetyltransferase n=1 Tax=Kineothrix sp. MB12-C1 TaxID=3070215 RepID=UPI0027D2899C|nr:GNAT family N-acetyltransferase [Kineothrix sp. MB12-C1]WMC93274.1 GNAT family N-acetyltransferase [Kineothrix sp. MB12-C1]
MNNITYKLTKGDVNWQEVSDVLRRSGLSDHSAGEQEIIFKNSYAVVFVYDKDKIVGVGRALSDGICQAAVYNIALDEEYQGYGIGRRLIALLLDQLKGQNIILYTHPRTVALYEKMGFRRNKTAMCIFDVGKEKQEWMEQEGFLLPEDYRFMEEISRF